MDQGFVNSNDLIPDSKTMGGDKMLPSRISGDGIIVAAANEQCDYIYLDNRVCNRGIRDDLDGPVAISKIPVPNSEFW